MSDPARDAALGNAPDAPVADKADHVAPAYGFGHTAPTEVPHGYQPTCQSAQMATPDFAPPFNNNVNHDMVNNHVHVNVVAPARR